MTKSTSMRGLLFAIVAAFFVLAGARNTYSTDLPDYCIWPDSWDYLYFTDYASMYDYGSLTWVHIESADGEVVLDHESDYEGPHRFWDDITFQLIPGMEYYISVATYGRYYARVRAWIDWDRDGEFINTPQYVEYMGLSYDYYYGNSNWTPYNSYQGGIRKQVFKFTVPEDASETYRFRIANTYYSYHYVQSPYSYEYPYDDACINGYLYEYTTYTRIYNYGEIHDYNFDVFGGVKDTYPSDGDILYADEEYDGTSRMKNGEMVDFPKPQIIFPAEPEEGALVRFYIYGPAPSTDIVYEGLAEYPSTSENVDVAGAVGDTYTIQHSRGQYSYPSSPYGDGTFKADRGGTYKVYAYQLESPKAIVNSFTVSWDNDLSVSRIVSPRTNVEPDFFKYVQGQSIRIIGLYRNVGINDVTEFEGTARIWDPNGELVYDDTKSYEAPPREVLSTSDAVELEFDNARFTQTGVYTIEMTCDLIDTEDDNFNGDQDDYNDVVPRSDLSSYTFEVSYEIQLQADEILLPTEDTEVLVNRTVVPMARFANAGIGDASDVPATMIVKNEDGETVYESNIIVQDIPAGKYNTKIEKFAEMTISEPGDYTVCVWLTDDNDPIREDDTVCTTFSVEAGMQGTFTVGTRFEGQERNYTTIDDMMDDIYFKGITGPITFEFTDASYEVSENNYEFGAWEFTSRIIGLGYDLETEEPYTITFKPHRDRANVKGGVTINLNSASGRGVTFGQSHYPQNDNAIAKRFPSPSNSNFNGYVVFDGGRQKALKFVLNTTNEHGSAFYLGRGSSNVTVKNCIIENGTEGIKTQTRIPLVTFDPSRGFGFEGDVFESGGVRSSYSAGIVSRSSLLKAEESEFIKLDTVPNTNNVIEGNEISGFGYGIMSLGIGALYMQNENYYQRFYNEDNTYSNNTITDCYRAGILLGFEEDSKVEGNRIYDMGGASNAAGILLGGNSRDDIDGYNNVDIMVNGNEISGIEARDFAFGISNEQVRITFQNPGGGVVYFPNKMEDIVISNNVVRGITGNANTNICGIGSFTRRYDDARENWEFISTPFEEDYFTRGDIIANNTVVMTDEEDIENAGAVAAIGIQNAYGATFKNNAILFEDESFDAGSPMAAGLFYQGPKTGSEGGLMSDRNAYFTGNATLFRFIETDAEGNLLEPGTRNEFQTLGQWQLWTGADLNSINADFTSDMDYQGNYPYKLRIDDVPELPLGSVLNNRGENLDEVTEDIDGNPRGSAGQRCDIGAFEFAGRMFVSDVEMQNIPVPGNYKAGDGSFNDAEYIMTDAPVEITANIRNNGSLQQSDINVYVKVFRQEPDGTYDEDAPVVDKTVKTSIPTTESRMVSFGLADGDNDDFAPATYLDLDTLNYTVPYLFTEMKANVTPVYKIEVSVESDQENDNNIIEKEVRFYIRKSPLKLLVSSENSMRDLYAANMYTPGLPTANEIAGRLNRDSLDQALRRLGWYTDLEEERFDVDLFDRTAWEERAVNYTIYRSIFWTDGDDSNGDDKGITRYQRQDIRDFLNEGVPGDKRNLVVSSQELVRELSSAGTVNNSDPEFVEEILRAENVYPYNPLGMNVSNNGNSVTGEAVGQGLTEYISASSYIDQDYREMDGNVVTLNDVQPYCGLMDVSPNGDGLARIAYNYENHDAAPNNSGMGVATTTLERNVVVLGVDWRHWANLDRVLRSVFDFVENNGGEIVPVELAAFDATAAGKRVDITWATASEYNSSLFEVEKAGYSEAGTGLFTGIGEMAAAGNSSKHLEYGPVTDYDVEYGNSYVYRLKMTDLDGKVNYSDEEVVTIGENGAISLGQAFPNPSKESAKFRLSTGSDVNISIDLYDMSGKLVRNVMNEATSGTRTIEVDTRNLTSGSYTLVLRSGSTIINRTVRVVK